MYWNYRGLKITLTSNQLELAYGSFNHKRIPLNKINSCDITKFLGEKYFSIICKALINRISKLYYKF